MRRRAPGLPRFKKRKTVARRRRRTGGLAAKIKSVVTKMAETKRLLYSTGLVNISGSFTTWNVMDYLGNEQGSKETNFIGEEYFVKGFDIRGVFTNNATNNATPPVPGFTPDGTYNCEVGVMLAPDYIAGGATYNINDLVIPDTTIAVLNYSFDSKKCRILWSRKMQLTPQIANNVGRIGFKQWIPINKKIVFKDWQASYELKGWNYYVYVFPGGAKETINGGGTASRLGTIQWDIKVYIKDM